MFSMLMSEEEKLELASSMNLPKEDYRTLPDGTFAYILRLAYTYGLHLGCTSVGLTYRFCFRTLESAREQMNKLEKYTDIPLGDWVACRPPSRLPNPSHWEYNRVNLSLNDILQMQMFTQERTKAYRGIDEGVDAFLDKVLQEANPDIVRHTVAWLLKEERLYAIAGEGKVKYLSLHVDSKNLNPADMVDMTERIALVLGANCDNDGIAVYEVDQNTLIEPLYNLFRSSLGHEKAVSLITKCRY